MGSILNNKRRI